MRAGTAAALTALLVLASRAARAEVLDDFEGPLAWTLSNGAEFPGAVAALTSGTGHTGGGAHLSYDFSGGGAYVAMLRDVTDTSPGRTLAFWLRADARVQIVVRLTDSGDQTLQYDLGKPFEAVADGEWSRVVLSRSATPNDHWGGANDGVAHGAVKNVAILVSRSDRAPVAGAIDVDDVGWIDPAPFEVDPFAPGAALPPSALFDRWGAAIHFTRDDRALDALKNAGFAWVRTDLTWESVERQPGVYDFSAFDALLDAVAARSMRAILILDYGNPLYGGGPPKTDTAIAAFAAYARAAAQHFVGRPVIFEVWNEPDNQFWPPGNVPLEYAALLPSVITAVHGGDAAAKVSTGGVSWFYWDYFQTYLGTGAAAGADYIGVHAYRNTPPETSVGDFMLLRALVSDLVTNDPPVINTEWGYTATSFGGDGTAAAARATQAVWGVRQQLSTWVAGVVVSIWYDVRDDCTNPTDGECNFGLLGNDYSDKPLMTAMRSLGNAARGRRLTALLSTAETPRAVRLEGNTDVVIVAWASEPKSTAELVVPTPLDATDVYGAAIALNPSAGKVTLTLDETKGPVYLRYDIPVGWDAGAPNGGTGNSDAGGGGANPNAGAAVVTIKKQPGGCGCRSSAAARSTWTALGLGVAVLWCSSRRRRRVTGNSGRNRADSAKKSAGADRA